METMTPRLAAQKVREAAKGYREDNKGFVKDYPEYKKGISADAKAIRHIASLIRTEKLSEARSAIAHLDTLVREYIPNDVYCWLGC